jgi:RNA polymerase sigma factor (sigma-70 family)
VQTETAGWPDHDPPPGQAVLVAGTAPPGGYPENDAEATDAEVIARSARDPSCFGVIFDRHSEAILRYAHARLGPDLAEDVLAETFLAAFARRSSYDESRPSSLPWLYGIAIRQIGKHRRAEHRSRQAMARLPVDALVLDTDDRLLDRVAAQALRPRLMSVLSGLTRPDRELLLLIAWAGLTYEETAEALGVPVSTVRSRLHRIRLKTRRALNLQNQAKGDSRG